jgi:hypothetical protein
MTLHRLVNWLIIGSLILIACAWWRADSLPAPDKLNAALQEEPDQRPTRDKPFETTVLGVQYRIDPRFTYEIAGLVVSMHHADTWWDYAHKEWNDNVNLSDLCVVWGENVRRDAYRQVSYSHDQWTCWFSWSGNIAPEHAFDGTAISNNHMVTDSKSIAHVLKDVHIGDEVRFRGYLADYTTFKDGAPVGMRKTSTVRTDQGNGACEVVWVQELTIIRSHNRPWRIAMRAGLVLLALSLIAWVALPVRGSD